MIDFQAICSKFNIQFDEKRISAGWIHVSCPYCGDEGTHGGKYLGYNIDSGVFNCWRCSRVPFLPTLTLVLRLSNQEALRPILAGFQIAGTRPAKAARKRQEQLAKPPGLGPLLKPHRAYLRGRGLNPKHLTDEWAVQGTGPLGGDWAWRVVFPISDVDGQVVAYQGRTIGSHKKKYKLTENDLCLEDPHGMLFGIHKALSNTVLVVEGATGVIRIGEGTVGSLGIDFHQEQVNALRRFKNRFVLFDPEPKAQRRAEQLATRLSLFGGSTEILSGHTTDPGEFTEARVRKLRRWIGMK